MVAGEGRLQQMTSVEVTEDRNSEELGEPQDNFSDIHISFIDEETFFFQFGEIIWIFRFFSCFFGQED